MVKRYNPHSSIDVSAWIIEDAAGSVVLASDFEALAAERDSFKLGMATANQEWQKDQVRMKALEAALHRAYNTFENITVADTLEIAKDHAHRLIPFIDSIMESGSTP